MQTQIFFVIYRLPNDWYYIQETMVVQMTLSLDFFNNNINRPRMCVLSTLCGNVDKHSPFDIYIYIYTYTYIWTFEFLAISLNL